jgi:transcription antitermination protein NusB
MANRHLARSLVLQTLFEIDFRGVKDAPSEEMYKRNAAEFAPGLSDLGFVKSLVSTILKKQPELDTIIEKAAPDWPIDKISIIDRNILRIGLSELLFADKAEVPAKVAINEAIELAKTYGGEKSGKFVNGVLGSVYKEMGEPGKDEVSKKKKRPEDVPFEKMKIERLGGAIVYAKHEGSIYFALVHDVFGHWTLPKGHIEEGEDNEKGASRAVSEEIGIPITIREKLGDNEYVASHPEKGKHRKQVIYFLAEGTYGPLKLETSGGLDDLQWFKIQDILDLNFYNDILPIVTKAVQVISTKQ